MSTDDNSDDDSETERVTFRVETLHQGTFDATYPAAEADEISEQLDQAATILACRDCGNLAPVTGGVPSEMPDCPGCGEALHGVVEVHRLDEDAVDDYQDLAASLEAGGVPEQTARAVALRALGDVTLQEISDHLGMGGSGNVQQALNRYAEEYEAAGVLRERGPDPDELYSPR